MRLAAPFIEFLPGGLIRELAMAGKMAGGGISIKFGDATLQGTFQMPFVGKQLAGVGLVGTLEPMEPFGDLPFKSLRRLILYAVEGHIGRLDFVGVGKLTLQGEAGSERPYRRLHTIPVGEEVSRRLDKGMEGMCQFAQSHGIVAGAIVVDFLHRDFPPAQRPGINDILPVVPLDGRGMYLKGHSISLDWHDVGVSRWQSYE